MNVALSALYFMWVIPYLSPPRNCGTAMDAVRATLAAWNLGQYADAFFKEGYDDLAYLKTLDKDRLQRVADTVGMKPGELGDMHPHPRSHPSPYPSPHPNYP